MNQTTQSGRLARRGKTELYAWWAAFSVIVLAGLVMVAAWD